MIFHKLALAASFATAALAAPVAIAQQPTAEQIQMIYDVSRNQQGVFEYCQAAGHIGADVVEIQTRIMAMMPPPAQTASGDAAYARGKGGEILAGPQAVTLADAAKGQSTTEKVLCERMGAAMKSAGASLPPR